MASVDGLWRHWFHSIFRLSTVMTLFSVNVDVASSRSLDPPEIISLLEKSKSYDENSYSQFHIENAQQGRQDAGCTSILFHGENPVISQMGDKAEHTVAIVFLPVALAPDNHGVIVWFTLSDTVLIWSPQDLHSRLACNCLTNYSSIFPWHLDAMSLLENPICCFYPTWVMPIMLEGHWFDGKVRTLVMCRDPSGSSLSTDFFTDLLQLCSVG